MHSPAIIRLRESECLTSQDADALAAHLLTESAFDYLLQHDADVYKPNGDLLLRFRKGVIPFDIAKDAYTALRAAPKLQINRGVAAGKIESAEELPGNAVVTGITRARRLRQDGTLSKTSVAKPTMSGIVGYFDRYPRIPYCRQTAFNIERYADFQKAYPFIKCIDELYESLAPEHYARQRAAADKTSQDFVIRGTAFTTVTVNKNWQTAVHKDAGDFKEGFGNLAVLEAGSYGGAYLCFPQFRVAVDVRSCDFLAMDVHEWHGNTPFVGREGFYERISVVCYYREKMHLCGTAEQELERAKRHTTAGVYKSNLNPFAHDGDGDTPTAT